MKVFFAIAILGLTQAKVRDFRAGGRHLYEMMMDNTTSQDSMPDMMSWTIDMQVTIDCMECIHNGMEFCEEWTWNNDTEQYEGTGICGGECTNKMAPLTMLQHCPRMNWTGICEAEMVSETEMRVHVNPYDTCSVSLEFTEGVPLMEGIVVMGTYENDNPNLEAIMYIMATQDMYENLPLNDMTDEMLREEPFEGDVSTSSMMMNMSTENDTTTMPEEYLKDYHKVFPGDIYFRNVALPYLVFSNPTDTAATASLSHQFVEKEQVPEEITELEQWMSDYTDFLRQMYEDMHEYYNQTQIPDGETDGSCNGWECWTGEEGTDDWGMDFDMIDMKSYIEMEKMRAIHEIKEMRKIRKNLMLILKELKKIRKLPGMLKEIFD